MDFSHPRERPKEGEHVNFKNSLSFLYTFLVVDASEVLNQNFLSWNLKLSSMFINWQFLVLGRRQVFWENSECIIRFILVFVEVLFLLPSLKRILSRHWFQAILQMLEFFSMSNVFSIVLGCFLRPIFCKCWNFKQCVFVYQVNLVND